MLICRKPSICISPMRCFKVLRLFFCVLSQQEWFALQGKMRWELRFDSKAGRGWDLTDKAAQSHSSQTVSRAGPMKVTGLSQESSNCHTSP